MEIIRGNKVSYFRGNYSFLNLAKLVKEHKSADTIQGSKYLRKYGIRMIKCIMNFGKNLELSTIVIPNYFLSNFKFDTCL